LDGGSAQPATVLRIGIETVHGPLRGEHRAQLQLCVPSMALKGDSYRLKDRDLGRVPAAASTEE